MIFDFNSVSARASFDFRFRLSDVPCDGSPVYIKHQSYESINTSVKCGVSFSAGGFKTNKQTKK